MAIGPGDDLKWLSCKEVPAEDAAAVPIGAEFANIPALQMYAESDDDAVDDADEDAEPRTQFCQVLMSGNCALRCKPFGFFSLYK